MSSGETRDLIEIAMASPPKPGDFVAFEDGPISGISLRVEQVKPKYKSDLHSVPSYFWVLAIRGATQ